jgi:hypothetical protein
MNSPQALRPQASPANQSLNSKQPMPGSHQSPLPKRRRRQPNASVPIERGSTEKAAAILGLKSRKLQAMAQRGGIPGAAKLGRQWTFDLAKLRRFVDQQEKIACQESVKRPPDATGAAIFSGHKFDGVGVSSAGRLKQMIQQSQKRVAKQAKRGR